MTFNNVDKWSEGLFSLVLVRSSVLGLLFLRVLEGFPGVSCLFLTLPFILCVRLFSLFLLLTLVSLIYQAIARLSSGKLGLYVTHHLIYTSLPRCVERAHTCYTCKPSHLTPNIGVFSSCLCGFSLVESLHPQPKTMHVTLTEESKLPLAE